MYQKAPEYYEQNRLVLSFDKKTVMQALGRKHPTQPTRPGHPEKPKFEYIHHGTRTLFASFVVATGEVVWDIGPTRTVWNFVAHVRRFAERFLSVDRFNWIVDNLLGNRHLGAELKHFLADLLGPLPRRMSEERVFVVAYSPCWLYVRTLIP